MSSDHETIYRYMYRLQSKNNCCTVKTFTCTRRQNIHIPQQACNCRQQLCPQCRHLTKPTKHKRQILAHWLHYVQTWRHPQNRKYITNCTVVRGGPSHGQIHTYRKFSEVWNAVFEICEQTDRQTDIQTRWLQYFTSLLGQNNKILT